MKCEHCGKNEVSFLYQSNINGHVEEKHLCAQCAEKLGYSQRVAAQSQRLMQSLFHDSFFHDSLFDGFPSLLGRMNRFLEDPFDDFFTEMPALTAAPARQNAAEAAKPGNLVEPEEQGRFSYLRQLNALKLEMKKAVHQENFERAAELRDEIRSLEAQHKEQKESR